MTPDGFRKIALSLPDAIESSHMNHPDFRLGKRVFATLGYPSHEWGMVKLTPLQQSQFMAAFPSVFVPAAGKWGLGGSTNVRLRSATIRALRPAMFEAWRNIAPEALVTTLAKRTK
jgi:hypothetical protein